MARSKQSLQQQQEQQQQSQRSKINAAFAPMVRQKQKVVPLPEHDSVDRDLENLASAFDMGSGCIGVHCLAEGFQRGYLYTILQQGDYGSVHPHPDLIHLKIVNEGAAFFFDYGVAVFWGMVLERERFWIQQVLVSTGCEVDPYVSSLQEQDEFAYVSSEHEKPNIANDVFTLSHSLAAKGGLDNYKISISQALAQSTKLSVFEEKVQNLVEVTKSIPEVLAKEGKVAISSREMAKQIGRAHV
eukprot:TRINITY_DN1635_c0_g1_i2.p1 TRINITY_DN1635_c0_g1~~TRINITY_DN1635_c0_g1_i2.p1  ORF type:complete len:272 (+),score=28.97 TRINITY_DN1635_c0_g1_i2:88-816(+)